MNDDELVQRARDGDEAALSALVARHHAMVYRVVLGILGDEDRAADAAQETFLKAFRGLAGFRGDAGFRSWLLVIASNEARGLLRRRGRRRETHLDDAPPLVDGRRDPATVAVVADQATRARACLSRLPEKQRMAVQLRIEEDLSFREVGEIIGSSEGAARVNYHHGIRRLREMLAGDRTEPSE